MALVWYLWNLKERISGFIKEPSVKRTGRLARRPVDSHSARLCAQSTVSPSSLSVWYGRLRFSRRTKTGKVVQHSDYSSVPYTFLLSSPILYCSDFPRHSPRFYRFIPVEQHSLFLRRLPLHLFHLFMFREFQAAPVFFGVQILLIHEHSFRFSIYILHLSVLDSRVWKEAN